MFGSADKHGRKTECAGSQMSHPLCVWPPTMVASAVRVSQVNLAFCKIKIQKVTLIDLWGRGELQHLEAAFGSSHCVLGLGLSEREDLLKAVTQ